MTVHVFGTILTGYGCAANNRGETEGNITTLQKIMWNNNVHTTVSAEAIRWALRYYWQVNTKNEVNRQWDDDKDDHIWQDETFKGWAEKEGKTYIDDDVLGFMKTEGAKMEGGREKGSATKRRGVLEIARAISLTPYVGDVTFNAKSGTKGRTSLYGTEVHSTRYQYGFAMTPNRLHVRSRCTEVIDAIFYLGEVAGNHSRFLFDFSPESAILRISDDPSPRILYCFEEDNGKITLKGLIRKIESGDILPEELYIGGEIANLTDIKSIGAKTCETGVKKVANACKENISKSIDGEE